MEEVVVSHRSLLGEGPVWDARLESICWIDILKGQVHEYHPAERSMKTLTVDRMIGAVAICKNGNFIAALQDGFGFIDRHSGTVTLIENPEPGLTGNRFNDGKADPAGRFWAGTMSHTDEPGKGTLYLLTRELSVLSKIEHVSISNGITWSLDQKIFYYIDTPTFTVAAYDFDKLSGDISHQRKAIQIPQSNGSPDGMTIDREGMLWIAHWDGWQVTRWNPRTGEKMLAIPMPVARVTSCCFGGDDFGDLYITTARIGLTEEQLKLQPLAGSLFVIKNIGYRGLPAFEFDA